MSADMDVDIHAAPSEDVDVTSSLAKPIPTEAGPARTEAMTLVDLQKRLDADISRHISTLAANEVDMHTPLIDSQGFPLANKDLMAIRIARQRINVLRNDGKALRERVAKLLELAMNGETLPTRNGLSSGPQGNSDEILVAFAKVNTIADNSPAESAGLRAGDRILKFGSLTSSNSDGLSSLAAPGVVVEGRRIQVIVKRDTTTLTIHLTPRTGWGGRGLLGCHLLPL